MKNKLTYLLTTLACVPISLSAQAFSDLVDNGDGTFTNWIGTLSDPGGADMLTVPGWVDHADHGRLYVDANGENVWLWDANLRDPSGPDGWIYTNRSIHPWFYVRDMNNGFWARYLPGVEGPEATPRIFLLTDYTPVLLSNREYRDIAELAGDAGLSTLVTAVGAADPSVATALTTGGPFTVFAPTNTAFSALGDTLTTLLEPANQGMLTDVLLYHVVSGDLSAADLTLDAMDIFSGESNSFFVETLLGADIKVEVTPMGVMLNGSAMVAMPNVMASNGTVHVIDGVLLPPENLATVATDAGFSELVNAVGAADPAVAAALTGDGPLTVFAPTNEAFQAISSTVAGLSTAQLTEILLYHVVPGKVYASEVPLDTPITTADTAGNTVTITKDSSGQLMINGAKIIATDVMAGNGVIHVIDQVILPPSSN